MVLGVEKAEIISLVSTATTGRGNSLRNGVAESTTSRLINSQTQELRVRLCVGGATIVGNVSLKVRDRSHLLSFRRTRIIDQLLHALAAC